jgi:hypothetical protein
MVGKVRRQAKHAAQSIVTSVWIAPPESRGGTTLPHPPHEGSVGGATPLQNGGHTRPPQAGVDPQGTGCWMVTSGPHVPGPNHQRQELERHATRLGGRRWTAPCYIELEVLLRAQPSPSRPSRHPCRTRSWASGPSPSSTPPT